ncbi:DnaD domain protein [Mobilitalea sibirica]|uniref:DnaD domain protein n=1 Tax=Mobilitalea sibirica TaxID=1462919 RepID=A0A8J7L0D7_9FIRM|nr:DnaD domain protein [Mobilitalea sibirica]MBH1942123.1 DnaD domain protein [Mobilitalea sibirica]
MNKISLHAEGISDITIVPNTFIDQYMPSANGAYVKVYLYLLRCFNSNRPEITISSIADHLENTEKDIIRSLNYWEKLNLLQLTRNEHHEIISIHLIDLNTSQNPTVDTDMETVPDSEEEIAVTLHMPKKPNPRQTYSTEKIAQLNENDEIKWAMHIIEIYLDRPLKPMDMQLILYLYEELKFSAELIMYLFEYCVSKNKKNISYIEAVALTWAEEGIDSEEKAREATATYNDHYHAVNKAFGLNRSPGQIERQYITKWVEVFGFSDEILTEACNRTILRTGKPDFKYADKILETWFKKGAKNMEDILKLDEEFSKSNKIPEPGKVTPITKPSSNKFNQYPQRTYTAKDYAELERKLLNKGL